MPSYIVETFTMIDGWVNCWHDGDDLAVFSSRQEAVKALDEFIKDYDLVGGADEYALEDYRIRKVEDEKG